MKYLRFINTKGEPQYGRLCNGTIDDSDSIIELINSNILPPANYDGVYASVKPATHSYNVTPDGKTITVAEIKQFLSPVIPPNIIAIGLNYSDHIKEFGHSIPTEPVIFLKATTSLNAHKCPIALPTEAPTEVDFEAELAIIIGKSAKNITAEQARDYIFGYTCANDITARDCQKKRDKQWARGKSFDSFCPLGPVIETNLDPQNLHISSHLNGQTMQDSNTSNLIFPVYDLVSYLSRNFTLLPGTVIMTGTPPGVGMARKPPVFLQPGDNISVTIEGIGTLTNPVTSP